MNQRQKKLLKILVNESKYLTVQSIANKMNVSLRTTHSDLKIIEKILEDNNMKLDKKPNVGIQIKGPLFLKKSLLNYTDETKQQIGILSTKMRRMKIISSLLSHHEGTSLNKLSEEFMVSKTSIVTDFEIIEKQLEQYNLILVRDKKGTRVEGTEKNIRHALSQLATDFLQLEFEEEYGQTRSRLDLSTSCRLKNLFDIEHIDIIEDIVGEAEHKLGYTINEISYVNLITHLLILIKRLKASSTYDEDIVNHIFVINTIEKTMSIAYYIADSISNHFHIDIPESEIKYIHQYLVCSGIQSDFLHLDTESYELNINNEYKELVEQMISFVSDSVHYDLREDKELRLSLITHILPLIQRLLYHVSIDNPLINEIKSQYSGMFSIVTLAVEMLDNYLLKDLSDDEVGFLTIHFQAAIERSMEQKQVIIVCPEGIGFSRLIAHRIERFISSVQIVDIVALSQLNSINLSGIDFVISTVPIKNCSKPIVLVSSFLSELDIRDINNFLVESAKGIEHHHLIHLSNIIDESVVFTQLDFQNKADVLEYLSQKIYEHGYVTKQYQKTVFEREDIMSTDLGNQVAIPHGSEKEIIISKVAIATLKNPIDWNKHQVSIVFLIAMSMEKPKKTKNILKDLYSIIDSQVMIEKMKKARSKQEIIDLINN